MKADLFSCHTPFTPPTTVEDELSFLRLIRSRRVGPTTFHRLLAEHGSARAALAALPEVAKIAGVAGYEPCPESVARAELRAGRKAGARLLIWGQQDYPSALHDIADAPPVLWALGDVALLARPCVALVGARNASSLGGRMARRLAQDLGAAGYTVVSGLARGIDAEAHRAALPTGTIGVQAGGIDVIYPNENAELAEQMAASGLRLAENAPGTSPQARHFPQRNRIIAGLSIATIVIEAAARSGSLLTVRMALDQGREVMAVPGHPMDARASGCNALIRDGATLVRGIEDILEVLGAAPETPLKAPPKPRVVSTAPKQTSPLPLGDEPLGQAILERLGPSPTPEDALIRDLGCDAASFARALMGLELDGLILRQPGAMIARA
ncbi:DNA-processing protein DprA [Sinirhodobacter sp. WL0062]|uniref:DNA-processing protein DprA n=1 Tax=Rhodobacter flavimaris TaxID=2907145 RepID=A0ABS8YVY6_9RHOB|nr:DNA-processing protein DprA [Sinirhodobacter sp. WL0062]MCE5974007.1 DNA-processing protein DprA [Sinirhodobacter sp. WL0062]